LSNHTSEFKFELKNKVEQNVCVKNKQCLPGSSQLWAPGDSWLNTETACRIIKFQPIYSCHGKCSSAYHVAFSSSTFSTFSARIKDTIVLTAVSSPVYWCMWCVHQEQSVWLTLIAEYSVPRISGIFSVCPNHVPCCVAHRHYQPHISWVNKV
jgi:hypothetical protein